jgi:hypothetical protein
MLMLWSDVTEMLKKFLLSKSGTTSRVREFVFHQLTEDVTNRDVALLNSGRVGGRHGDGEIDTSGESPAILADQANGFQISFFSFVYRLDDVGRIAACADADSDVAWPTQRLNLSSEYPLKAVVICHRGKNGRIGRQCDRSQAGSFNNKAPNELCGEMLRICRAAPIAEEQKFASGGQAIANQKGGLDNLATAVAGDF